MDEMALDAVAQQAGLKRLGNRPSREGAQTLLHAQIFREQRWLFPRFLASTPMP
jgi:hypothetical protein